MTARPLYHSFAWAYDLIVPRPAGLDAGAVAELLRARGVEAGTAVVDAGCGTGTHAVELSGRGYRVTGVDRSPELVEHARAKGRTAGSDARFDVGDLLRWRPDAPAGAVVCRGVLNDLVDGGERREALRALAQMLAAGGGVVLDVRDWVASAARYRERPLFERELDTPRGRLAFRSETEPRPAHRTLQVRERIELDGEVTETEFRMRCWTPDELDAGLRAAGLCEIAIERGAAGVRGDRLVATAVRDMAG